MNTLTLSEKITSALRGEESEVEIYWDAQDSTNAGPDQHGIFPELEA